MKFFTSAILLLFVLQCNQILAQAGTLDAGFNKTGTEAISQIGTAIANGCYSMAILKSGKILMAGAVDSSGTNVWVVVRLNKNGVIDETFLNNGHSFTFLGGRDDIAHAVAFQNGIVYIAGLTTGPIEGDGSYIDDMCVAEYNLNGPIPNFPNTDYEVFDHGHDTAFAIAVQKNGLAVVAGVVQTLSGTGNDFGLFRTLGLEADPKFNSTGKVTTDFNETNDGAYALSMQGNNIIAAGYTTDLAGKRIPALARYTSTGKLDSSFGTNGKVVVSNESLGPIHSVKALPNGKIIATCTMHGSINNLALIQFKHNGALDNTFGIGGIAHSNFTGVSYSVAVESTGKFVIGGSTGSNFEIARFKSNGTLDSTFGTNGEVITSSLGGTAYSIGIDPDGKYVLAGSSSNGNFEVARYLSGLVLLKQDFEETGNSTLIYPNPIKNIATLNYTLPKTEAVTISLFDITGKLVKQFADNINKSKGLNRETLNMESVPAGEYILEVKTPSQNISIKIVKQ